jgi:preprotein translocase subunit SecG
MFLYYLLITLFVILCFLLAIIILLQKGKGSLGLGYLGGSTQMLFGGSGGQDLFQKITWAMGALFMTGSLVLALMKTASYNKINISHVNPLQPTQQLPINQE